MKKSVKIKSGRVRTWNIIAAFVFVGGIASIIAPFKWPSLQKDFWGNVISGIWGLWIAAITASVFYQRFRVERFFTEKHNIYLLL